MLALQEKLISKMKRFCTVWLAFFIFSGSLIPKCDFNQFAKVPALVKHYQKHLSLSDKPGELNFFQFLAEHYLEDEKHHEEDHQDLPLLNHIVNGIFFIINSDLTLHSPFYSKSKKIFIAYSRIYIFNSVFSLLQPPKK